MATIEAESGATTEKAEICDCIDLTNAALKAHNTELGIAFEFSRKTGECSATVGIETEIIEKKRGAKAKRVLAKFCPFCGAPYPSLDGGS